MGFLKTKTHYMIGNNRPEKSSWYRTQVRTFSGAIVDKMLYYNVQTGIWYNEWNGKEGHNIDESIIVSWEN